METMTDWQPKEIVVFIGTRKIALLEGTLHPNHPVVTRFVTMQNPEGFSGGLVNDIDRAAASIFSLFEKLYPNEPLAELSCSVVLGNAKLKVYQFSSSQYYQGTQKTLSAYDIRSIVNQTRSVATLPLTEFILQSVPESFIVNDMSGIHNPIGLDAHRLGVDLKIFTMNFQDFKNLNRVFETLEVEVKGYFPKTLALAEAILTEQEKQDGALITDIADDTVYFSVWKNGALAATKAVAIGAKRLTEQVASKWNIAFADAEKVKERYGSLDLQPQFGEEIVPLVERNGHEAYSLSRQAFHEDFMLICHSWLTELVGELSKMSEEYKLFYPHYVFTGGGTRMDGFLEHLLQEFSITGRIGLPRQVDAPNELLVDPAFASALGMFRWLSTNALDYQKLQEPRSFFEKTLSSARHWFAAYF